MVSLGYALSSEEHPPNDLVKYAQRAEETGFSFAFISDHFHPWVSQQGQSPFVWSVMGAIARATRHLQVGTGVTCPIIRIHPAIIAQAAATTAAMMPGRFFLGVGSGENLNEHIFGDRWPTPEVRLEMLQEAIEVIRTLWRGGWQNHHGRYYRVEDARLFTLPEQPPPLVIAASGKQAAELAGNHGDGLVNVEPNAEIAKRFSAAGGKGKPCYGQVTVCWAREEKQARTTAHEWWPTAALEGELFTEIKTPTHFEQAVALAREEDVARAIVCGSDPQLYIDKIQKYVDAGYSHVYIHQVGPDQEGFFKFYQQEILPHFQSSR